MDCTVEQLLNQLYTKSWLKRMVAKVQSLGVSLNEKITEITLSYLGNFIPKLNKTLKQDYPHYVTFKEKAQQSFNTVVACNRQTEIPERSSAIVCSSTAAGTHNRGDARLTTRISGHDSDTRRKEQTNTLRPRKIERATLHNVLERGVGIAGKRTNSKTETELLGVVSEAFGGLRQSAEHIDDAIRESANIVECSANIVGAVIEFGRQAFGDSFDVHRDFNESVNRGTENNTQRRVDFSENDVNVTLDVNGVAVEPLPLPSSTENSNKDDVGF